MPSVSKTFRDLRYRLFYGIFLNGKYPLATLCAPGSICPWTICPAGLNARSVVYSAGVGSDITFEHELVKQFGCEIVLLDPSPTGVRTMSLPENRIASFHFFAEALAARDGELRMAPPKPGEDSWFPREDPSATLTVPCTNLGSLMGRNGHKHIDLLKLDIEGSEYEVIDDLLDRRIPVRQVCVEFHHGILPGIRRRQSIRAMFRFLRRGYKMISQQGANHTFIRRPLD